MAAPPGDAIFSSDSALSSQAHALRFRLVVGTHRTAWHLPFGALIAERAPPGFRVRQEVRLTHEPQRADLLLRRRSASVPTKGRVLRRLWGWLAADTIVEFKSLARPFRAGDLVRLWGYGVQHHAQHAARLRPHQITLLLVVPSLTPALRRELDRLGFSMHDLGGGYRRIDGMVYLVYVVLIDEVAESEHDALLSQLGHHPIDDSKARWWFHQFIVQGKEKAMVQKLEGYDEMLQRFVDGLTPQQRLKGLAPAQRLEGLSPEQQILAMSDEVLRTLPEDFLRSLSSSTQQAIRARTKRSQRQATSTPHASAAGSTSTGRSRITSQSRTPRSRSK